MKKYLIITFAICALALAACGSVQGSSTLSIIPAPHLVTPTATPSPQSVCQVLRSRQAQLQQEYQTANAQLATSQADGDTRQAGDALHRLFSYHQSLFEGQTQLKTC